MGAYELDHHLLRSPVYLNTPDFNYQDFSAYLQWRQSDSPITYETLTKNRCEKSEAVKSSPEKSTAGLWRVKLEEYTEEEMCRFG